MMARYRFWTFNRGVEATPGEGRSKSLQLFRQDRCGSLLPINGDFFCFFCSLLRDPCRRWKSVWVVV